MAVSLTITVTDAQALRARTAFGKWDRTDPANPVWVIATGAQMQQYIKDWVKSRTLDYETTQAAEADRATRSAEVW